MGLLDSERFLLELNNLFNAHKKVGSIWLTFKYCEDRPAKKIKTGDASGSSSDPMKLEMEPYCLIRATDGKKVKISTKIKAKEVPRFQQSYANILLLNVDNLKKPVVSKKEKVKKAKA